jgi:hypothetical protein
MVFGGRNRYPIDIALAIVAAVAFSSGTARAGCGDHVRVLDSSSTSFTADGTPGGRSTATDDHQGRPFLPCHGPDCSANPTTPVLPVGVSPVGSADTKCSAARGIEAVDDGPCCGWNRPIDGQEREISRTNPIFHPPQRS